MTLDDLIIITCLVLAVICHAGYQHFSWNVYLKTKYRRSLTGTKIKINGGKSNVRRKVCCRSL